MLARDSSTGSHELPPRSSGPGADADARALCRASRHAPMLREPSTPSAAEIVTALMIPPAARDDVQNVRRAGPTRRGRQARWVSASREPEMGCAEMQLQELFAAGARRRLVNLEINPLHQLKLPIVLLAITATFLVLFFAHTHAAFGSLVAASFETAWIHELAGEITRDFFVVSVVIGLAYAIVVLTVCLAGAHRALGPIVALERHLSRLRNGDYSSRVALRAGHPLERVADDLNALADVLMCGAPTLAVGEEDIDREILRIHRESRAAGPRDPVAASGPAIEAATLESGRAVRTPFLGWYSALKSRVSS